MYIDSSVYNNAEHYINNMSNESIKIETSTKEYSKDSSNNQFDKQWNDDNQFNKKELDKLIQKSGKDINNFFNTSGLKYRELKLKNKLQNMSYEEKLNILSTDGMLVKRPLLELTDNVLIGFKEKEWNDI